ncbi:hypothetical protein PQQ99_36225 [Paraburkholderia sediminicola]|uniref:hypothetical protein n=1 Tax=Paraburkholderia sediminicola TaxID=458836 RepID=UPI0038BBA73F
MSSLRRGRMHARLAWLTLAVAIVLTVLCGAKALYSLSASRAAEAIPNARLRALRVAHELALVSRVQLAGRDRPATLTALLQGHLAQLEDVDAIALHDDTGPQVSERVVVRNRSGAANSAQYTVGVPGGALAGARLTVWAHARPSMGDMTEIGLVTLLLALGVAVLGRETLRFSLERGPWQRERVVRRLIHNAAHGRFNHVWKGTRRCDADLRAPLLASRMLALSERYERVARLAESRARIETSAARQTLLRELAAHTQGADVLDAPTRVQRLTVSVVCYHRFAAILHASAWSVTALLLHPAPSGLLAFVAGALAGSVGRQRPGTQYLLFFTAAGLAQVGLIVEAAPLPEALLGAAAMLGLRATLVFDQQARQRHIASAGAVLGALLIGPLFGLLVIQGISPSGTIVLLSLAEGVGLMTILHASASTAALRARPERAPRIAEWLCALLAGSGCGMLLYGALDDIILREGPTLSSVTAAVLCCCAWAGTREPSRRAAWQMLALVLLALVGWTTHWLAPLVPGAMLWLSMRCRTRLYRRAHAPVVALARADCAAFAAGTLAASANLLPDLLLDQALVYLGVGAVLVCIAWLCASTLARRNALA